MTFLFLLLLVLVSSPFFWVYWHDKRTLWLGFWFLVSGSLAGIIGIYLTFVLEWQFFAVILVVLGALFILTLMLAPLISLIALLYSGLTLIRREGFNLVNSLALMLAFGMIGYMVIWPILASRLSLNWPFFNVIYGLMGSTIFYFAVLVGIFFVTNILNFIHFVRPRYSYIVVLGAGLNGTEVTPLLASRIDKAIKLWRRRPQEVTLIMSGGQGPDEVISEGEAMKAYALRQGVPQSAILVDNQSRNTHENLLFSYKLMEKGKEDFVIVTNYYHLLRALILARRLGLKCQGYGAKTKLYFSINAFLREFIGYLTLAWRLHLSLIGGLWGLTLVLYLLHGLFN